MSSSIIATARSASPDSFRFRSRLASVATNFASQLADFVHQRDAGPDRAVEVTAIDESHEGLAQIIPRATVRGGGLNRAPRGGKSEPEVERVARRLASDDRIVVKISVRGKDRVDRFSRAKKNA